MPSGLTTTTATTPCVQHGTPIGRQSSAFTGQNRGGRMSRLAENWYPTIVALAATVMYFVFARYRPLPPEVRYVFQSVMNVAAIGAGFSATTMSILLAIDARWIVQRAREAGAHELLTDYLIGS